MVKTKILVALGLIFSVLLLACDPDEDTFEPIKIPVVQTPLQQSKRKACTANRTPLVLKDNRKNSRSQVTYANEPEFGKQWYLQNTKNPQLDINIVPAWDKGYGTKQIKVAVLDDAIDKTHSDLSGVKVISGYYYYDSRYSHGTNSTGLIAARDNGLGIIGVLPQVDLYSYAVLGDSPSLSGDPLIQALNESNPEIAVYNSSLGLVGIGDIYYKKISSTEKQAFDKVTNEGFDGKGSSLVLAAGNYSNNAAIDGYLHHHAVIAVNAIKKDGIVPSESSSFRGNTMGENLWITAPSGLITTTNGGGYKANYTGTSSAAPLVSGAIGLLRSEFPDLTYRDVKLILAESASKYDYSGRANYQKTRCLYSQPQAQQTYSSFMGFGLLDVSQALAVAQNWQLLPAEQVETYSQTTLSLGEATEYSHEFELDSTIDFIESVTVNIETDKRFNLDWNIELSNPSGRKSNIKLLNRKTFTSLLYNTFLGNYASGKWKLNITRPDEKDRIPGRGIVRTIEKLTITFRGH